MNPLAVNTQPITMDTYDSYRELEQAIESATQNTTDALIKTAMRLDGGIPSKNPNTTICQNKSQEKDAGVMTFTGRVTPTHQSPRYVQHISPAKEWSMKKAATTKTLLNQQESTVVEPKPTSVGSSSEEQAALPSSSVQNPSTDIHNNTSPRHPSEQVDDAASMKLAPAACTPPNIATGTTTTAEPIMTLRERKELLRLQMKN